MITKIIIILILIYNTSYCIVQSYDIHNNNSTYYNFRNINKIDILQHKNNKYNTCHNYDFCNINITTILQCKNNRYKQTTFITKLNVTYVINSTTLCNNMNNINYLKFYNNIPAIIITFVIVIFFILICQCIQSC